MYEIRFWKWKKPKGEDTDGYNAWDYLSATPGAFGSKSEAQRWLRQHHKGPDEYGVKALFRVVKVRSNSSRRAHTVTAVATRAIRKGEKFLLKLI